MARTNPILKSLAYSIEKDYKSKIEDIEKVEIVFMESLLETFSTFTDTRQEWKIEYKFSHIIMVVMLCLFARVKFLSDMSILANKKIDFFNKIFKSDYETMPSADTLADVLAIIDKNELENLLPIFLKSLIDNCCKAKNISTDSIFKDEDHNIKDILATDGKEIVKSCYDELTGKNKSDCTNFEAVNSFSVKYGIAMRILQVECETNEIITLPTLISSSNIEGVIVTADAINTQEKTVEQIVSGGGYYLLPVKKNQHNTYEELSTYFNSNELLNEIMKKPNGYIEEVRNTGYYNSYNYKFYITNEVSWMVKKWKDLKSIGYMLITITNKKTNEVSYEKRYYITNLSANAKLFAQAARSHWQVEVLHYYLDVSFNEDHLLVKNKNVLESLTILSRFVLAILQLVRPSLYKSIGIDSIRGQIYSDFEFEITRILKTLSYISQL